MSDNYDSNTGGQSESGDGVEGGEPVVSGSPLSAAAPGAVDNNNDDLLSKLQAEARQLAELAVNFDANNDLEAAVYYYRETADVLKKCLHLMTTTTTVSPADMDAKRGQYLTRAQTLMDRIYTIDSKSGSDTVGGGGSGGTLAASEESAMLLRAECLMREALDEDGDHNVDEAIELYTQSIELCIQAKNITKDESLKKKLTTLATSALDRAEALKQLNTTTTSTPGSDISKGVTKLKLSPSNTSPTTTTQSSIATTTSSSSSSPTHQKHVISGQTDYTREEIQVLRQTSIINGREYVPFLSVDLKERFSYPMPYSDKDGLLVLAPKQRHSWQRWARLDELSPSPAVISDQIDCFAIKQTIVSDCSFVASLAVSALYEKRFAGRRLITNIVYPQRRDGRPVYNPCGKYMVKFNINGVARKVLIDDRLPVDKYGQLLCSYSSNKQEFWVSLLEKAYMKVMGGYDFPGSNSNIDLHALTGWIPERLSLSGSGPESEREKTFKMLCERHAKGDVLITIATGELSDAECERTGLVATHAYAMLDIRAVMNKRLFLLKNPWSHLRWKGNYSERDVNNWTKQLKDALHYDPQSARNFDNGVFWIDMDSLYRFYDVAYLNWNPSLFKYTYCTHDSWSAGVGPVKDIYNIGDNPQYSLTLKSPDSTVWVLLTRHITDKNDFANNKEYIALLVYKNTGEKVYLPFDPPPHIDGVRINSPHYLCKIMPTGSPSSRYTLVISQYEKSATIHYTIRAYSTGAFQLKKLVNPYKYKEIERNGKWTAETAGGCANNRDSYHKNPVYQLTITSANDTDNQLLIDLKGPKDYAIGIDLVAVTVLNPSSVNYFQRQSSGAFRSGFTVLQLRAVPAGTYNIIPSTYKPNQLGPFFLEVQSTTPLKLSKLR
ncbi:calpain-7-like isoform X2 [Oppia nitens]|uniref:calpain-7-like isoform X2 n=1 Tax=Oppia nitens TaxID=1686743 RepID=UPI0023D9DA95|nr:calpain-7-like isoform X2 [Oppia nitens]